MKDTINRRNFIKATGGITFLIASYPLFSKDALRESAEEAKRISITGWVRIGTDGEVIVYNPAAEMGQGSMTTMAILLAEEMDADWSKVQVEYAPVEPENYGRSWGRSREAGGTMMTVGSATVSGYYNMLRHAGAQVRYVLMQNVAEKWNVSLDELETEPGFVIHKKNSKKISYGEIATFATTPKDLPEIPDEALKSPDQFRLIGKYIPRVDVPAKTDGSAEYSMDVRLPNMVYAVISRSPVNGSKPVSINASEIQAIEGVVDVISLDYGAAIIAESMGIALQAKRQLKIEWSTGLSAEHHNSLQAPQDYVAIVSDDENRGNEVVNKGNPKNALKEAFKTYSIDYLNDHVYHAQMEPLNAVVSVSEDGESAEIWAGTQAPGRARAAAANVLGIDTSKVKFNCCYLGGGFGRRSLSDYIEEAALLAKKTGRPLKLLWTREDDLQYGAFRPMSLQRMQAGVDESGNISAWTHQIVGTGKGLLASGAKTDHYTIPNQLVEIKDVEHGIRTKHWRAVGHGPNKFAIETFIDEIAADLNIDPVAYRMKLMDKHPRAQEVLKIAAEMSNWGAPLPQGRAKGVAFAERSGSLAAGVCEISLDKSSNKIKVHNIWTALDAGVVVQPDNVKAQMEGAIVFGLSSVLNESISFKNGVVQESNFHDYPLLRMEDSPESIEVKIIDSTEPPTGVGEAGLPFVGGAISNAFYALTKKRLRHMPFTAARVDQLLKS